MSVALMIYVTDMHAVRPQCQKLITSARTEVVRCHMQDTNTTPIATKNRTNQMSSVMVVLSQALHPCTVCLRTCVQTLENTWLDGKRRPKRQQLPLPESRSAVPLCRLHAPQTWPGNWAGDEKFAEAALHNAHACCRCTVAWAEQADVCPHFLDHFLPSCSCQKHAVHAFLQQPTSINEVRWFHIRLYQCVSVTKNTFFRRVTRVVVSYLSRFALQPCLSDIVRLLTVESLRSSCQFISVRFHVQLIDFALPLVCCHVC